MLGKPTKQRHREINMIDPKLQGKVALITGANHGIGAATAKALAAEGVAVLINFLRMPPLGEAAESSNKADLTTPSLAYYNRIRSRSAEEVVQSIREMGGRAEAIEADLSDPAAIPFLFEQAETLLGLVDILVNDADYCTADTFVPHYHSGSTDLAPRGYAIETITAEIHDRH